MHYLLSTARHVSLVTFEDVLISHAVRNRVLRHGLMETPGGQSKGFREATYALRQLTPTPAARLFPLRLKSLASVYARYTRFRHVH